MCVWMKELTVPMLSVDAHHSTSTRTGYAVRDMQNLTIKELRISFIRSEHHYESNS